MDERKAKAFKLFDEGVSYRNVAAAVQCAGSTAQKWRREWKDARDEAAAAISTPMLTLHRQDGSSSTIVEMGAEHVCERLDGLLSVEGYTAIRDTVIQRDDPYLRLKGVELAMKMRIALDALLPKDADGKPKTGPLDLKGADADSIIERYEELLAEQSERGSA